MSAPEPDRTAALVREIAEALPNPCWAQRALNELSERVDALVAENTQLEGTLERSLAENTRLREAIKRETDDLGMQLAIWCPHWMDSRRVGDYLLAAEMRASVERLRAALSAVAPPPPPPPQEPT